MELDVEKLRLVMVQQGVSQVELARRSKLSRTRLNVILKQGKAQVHPDTATRISRALGLAADVLDKEGTERSYLEAVAEHHSTLDFSGLGIVTADSLMPMDQVFASLKVRERPKQCSENSKTHGPLIRPQKLATALSRSSRFFLLGEPGAGKTTLLRQMAGVYAAGKQAEYSYPSEQFIPIFVRLADWGELLRSGTSVDAIDVALSQMNISDPRTISEWLHNSVDSTRILLLLDGLDEVSDPDLRGLLLDGLRSFLQSHAEARVVVSSRVVGFEAPALGNRFDTFALEPLSIQAVRNFAAAWIGYRHGHKSTQQCSECERRLGILRHAIVDNPRIRSLATNPMMLSILLLLQEAGVVLPQRRWDLYEKLSEAFLFSWQEKKRAALSSSPDSSLGLEDRELVWLLESLGLEMQSKDRTLVPRWWMAEHLRWFLEAELAFNNEQASSATDALIWSLQERSGLIAERGPERYGFRHLGIQEYFAARAILASEDAIGAVQRFIYHPRWREVIRLVAGQLDRRRAPQLIRFILDDPDPAGRTIGRGLLTALGCLVDGAPVSDKVLLDQLSCQTADLGRSKWLGVTLEALDLLADMRSTRLQEFANRTVAAMLNTAKEFLDADDWSLLSMRAVEIGLGVGVKHELGDDEDEVDAESLKPVMELELGEDHPGLILCVRPASFESDWAKEVVDQLQNDSSPRIRAACASELRRFVKSRPGIRERLCEALVAEREAKVRVSIAHSLAPVARYANVKHVLISHLTADPDDEVKGACAAALGSEADCSEDLRRRLWSLLRSNESCFIREGAARGLSRSAQTDKETLEILFALLIDAREEESVRVACLRALERVLPSIPAGIEQVSRFMAYAPSSKLAQVTAHILAHYAADATAKWSQLPIERIEQVLVSIAEPCQHYLDALRALVDARELRKLGVPREARIKAALSDWLPRIRALFVFGSSARGDQTAESDVDLMVIGDVSLRDVAPGLRRAEQELGRQVNAVVYSPEEWNRRCQDRNPFVTQVLKSEKVFILGSCDELESMVG